MMTPQQGATKRREQEPSTPSIEMAFATLKAHLRAAEARAADTLIAALGRVCGLFQPSECQNYFTAAGYASE